MVPRTLAPTLLQAAGSMPVVAVTGPRQSGETTLCRATFPDHSYVSVEPLDTRDFAASDFLGGLRAFDAELDLDPYREVARSLIVGPGA